MATADGASGRVSRAVIALLGIVMVLAIVALFGTGGSPNRRGRRDATPPSPPVTVTVTVPETTTTMTPVPTTAAPPTDLGRVVVEPSAAMARQECGSALPVAVSVGGTDLALLGPAPATPVPDHQVVRHWVAPKWTVEVRWPADTRDLLAADGHPEGDAMLIESWGMGSGGLLSARGGSSSTMEGPLLFDLSPSPDGWRSDLPAACSVLQVRITMADGQRETLGIRLPLVAAQAQLVDLGPLIGLRRSSSVSVPRDRSTQCPDRVDSVATVAFATPAATPEEALRIFAGSNSVLDVPEPGLPRPFTETKMTSDGTYRFERYLAWTEYVAVTVARMGDGWAVTNWEHGEC